MSVSNSSKPQFFEVAVAQNYKKGMSKSESITRARKDYPDLYDRYIARVNKNLKNDFLPKVFELCVQGK